MLEGPYLKKVLIYTLPIILTNLLQLTFNAADLIVVGQFCGSNAVGAVGATGSLNALFVNLFVGLSVGVGVSVAQAIGAHNPHQTEKLVHTAFPIAWICGLVLTVLGITCSEPILDLMGTPREFLSKSAIYMKIHFCGSLASLTYNFGAAVLRAVGDTKSPLIFLSLSGVVNVALNTLFVTTLPIDVEGVALATIISQYLSAILVMVVLAKRTDACRFSFRKIRIYRPQMLKILRIGIPSGIQSSLFSVANVQIQSAVNSFGPDFVSGSAAASNLIGFAQTATNTFNQAAVNFIGQNAGAKKMNNVKSIFRACITCTIVAGLISGALLIVFAQPLLAIYLTDSEKALSYGVLRLLIIGFPSALAGVMEVSTGALRGLGNSVSPMIVSLLGVCGFRILWINTIFLFFRTPTVLLLSFPVSWLITFLAEYILFRIELKKKKALP